MTILPQFSTATPRNWVPSFWSSCTHRDRDLAPWIQRRTAQESTGRSDARRLCKAFKV